MVYAYCLEVFPDHKKLGLKRLVGSVHAYFDTIPTKAKALKVVIGQMRRMSKLDIKYMGKKLVKEEEQENKIFYRAIESVIREVDIPKT